MKTSSRVVVSIIGILTASFLPAQTPKHADVFVSARTTQDAEILQLTNGTLRIKPCDASIIRITFVHSAEIPDLSNPAIPDASCPASPFTHQESATAIEIFTAKVHISISKNTGSVQFSDSTGKESLKETDWPYPRLIRDVDADGMPGSAGVWFTPDADEHIYGLGQHQTGLLDQRNTQLELSQDNTNISIPFFVSSKGYGILWNNSAVTEWNNRFRPVIAIQTPGASAVDYFFLYGPALDQVIHGYRKLSGDAPLFSKWAYGFWQSRLAYRSTREVLETAEKYRALHIPIDNIVIDAGWETIFGSRQFTSEYPDPAGMINHLHDLHMHVMVSIWPLFQPGSPNYDQFSANHLFVEQGPNKLPAYLPGARLYDAFSEAARDLYWKQVRDSLYQLGVDAYWLDSTEPADLYAEEHGPMLAGAKTALGNGSTYANLYPLMTTAAIYDGLRSESTNKRAFILTRSAFTGMQRNASAAWSGDTLTNFDTFRRQIPAGLNYSLSGLPYWTTDIGGFVGGDTTDPAYRELYVRWFEYGAFCPIFRTHGARNQNELWSFGAEAQKILTKYDRLRYRLQPYIYSLAAKTTFEQYTPMRALVFDFPGDPRALSLTDEFMLGPALLVAPVMQAGATAREVYLPKGTDWYDFWTGHKIAGGQTIHREAPLSVLPLYVRAGSVLPLGPDEQFTDEKSGGPIELRVYPGPASETALYYDDGSTYAYEKGSYTWVPIVWDQRTHTLSLKNFISGGGFILPPTTYTVISGVAPYVDVSRTNSAERKITYKGLAQEIKLAP